MSETTKVAEAFRAALDRASQAVYAKGVSSIELIGLLTLAKKAQPQELLALGFRNDADSEGDEVEES